MKPIIVTGPPMSGKSKKLREIMSTNEACHPIEGHFPSFQNAPKFADRIYCIDGASAMQLMYLYSLWKQGQIKSFVATSNTPKEFIDGWRDVEYVDMRRQNIIEQPELMRTVMEVMQDELDQLEEEVKTLYRKVEEFRKRLRIVDPDV